jgi:branched-chain amino acid transport system substrate-binding protein
MKSLGIVTLLALAFTANAQAADPLSIGMIAPTTGPLATIGARQLSVVQWWAQDIIKKGGINGHTVQILSCNDEGSPERAVNCGRDLIGKGIVLLINASVTGPIKATMPLVVDGPVMLTPSPNVLPEASTNVYQVSPSDVLLTEAIAEYLKANGKDRLAIIASTDASGEVGVASAATVFPKAGIKYDLARIDLRANDASIQLANVAKANVPLIYSNYSGGGAAAVIKSFNNLGLTQPLLVSYANMSDSFINLIKNDMPPRLLGIAIKSLVPDLLSDPKERERTAYITKAYKDWKNESVDQLTLTGALLADTVEAILTNVADAKDPAAVRKFLESTPIKSVQTIRFSKTSHIGMGTSDIAIVEYKGGKWVKADPLK